MRLLVCGGRDYTNLPYLRNAMLSLIHDGTEPVVIHGAARGADKLAGQIADEFGFRTLAYPADWETHGKKAGFVRNTHMLREGRPDCVLAAPGGKGTAMMVDIARRAGVPVVVMPDVFALMGI